jgi:hypothetical protein
MPTMAGLAVVTLLAAPSALLPLYTAFWFNSTYAEEPSVRPFIIATLWAVIVVLALSHLWRSALSEAAPDGNTARAQAALALIIGFAAALGPLGSIFGYGAILHTTLSAGLLAPAGIWLASEARKRGARVLGMIAMILCSIGLVYALLGFAAGALIPIPPPS